MNANKNFTESIRSRIKDSKNNRIYANNKIYYNFYNNDLLYLCGYENQDLKTVVEKKVQNLRKNESKIRNLFENNRKFLTKKAGRGYNRVFYLKENCYNYLIENLTGTDTFFIGLSPLEGLKKKSVDHYFLLTDLVKAEDPKDWEKNVKEFFKLNQGKIAGFVLTPVLIKEGGFLSEARCQEFIKICKQHKIPVVWDESESYFYRSGPFFFLNKYRIKPDIIVINSSITLNRPFHLMITNRKYSKVFSPEEIEHNEKITLAILMASLEDLILSTNLIDHIKNIGHRLDRKLSALKANTKSSFDFYVEGLITIITVPNPAILNKLESYLRGHDILVYEKNCVLLLPQLTITNQSVDLFVQILNDFFKEGVRISK